MKGHNKTRTAPRPKLPMTDNITDIEDISRTKRRGGVNEYAFEITKSFKNHLTFPVVLIDRNNFAMELPSQQRSNSGNRDLVVDVTMIFASDVVLDVHHILDGVDEKSPKELQLFKRSLNNNQLQISYDRRKITFSYCVNEFLLRRNHYQVYLDQLDMVVCKKGFDEDVVHPYSLSGQALLVAQKVDILSYHILINDPDEVFGDRYANINGMTYKVPSTVDSTVKPGVYVYANHLGEDGTRFYSFEDADELVPLFPTVTLADQAEKRNEDFKIRQEEKTLKFKEELMDKEQELTKLKNDISLAEMARKNEHEEKMFALKQQESQLKQMELEYKRLSAVENQRLSELKYDLEVRQANRKDTSDFFKWLPAVATGILALLGVFI